MPVYVLQYDYGVVHEHAHGKGYACQADDVEVPSRAIHEDKGAYYAYRYGRGHHDRCRQATEEYEQHDNCQHTPYEDVVLHQSYGSVYIGSLVIDPVQVYPLRPEPLLV